VLAQLRNALNALLSRSTSLPAGMAVGGGISIADMVSQYQAAIDRHRELFDAMVDADQVKDWFESKMGFFFMEWPRGKTPFSCAINGARASRFGAELEAFVAELEAHWLDPSKNCARPD
jgi:hypothetical protein